jgi:serine protease Do
MIDFARVISRVSLVVTLVAMARVPGLAQDEQLDAKVNDPSNLLVIATKPMDKSVQELAVIAKKSVVVVTFLGRDGQQQGLGAGFIVSSDGLIATNLHVIGEARPIRVELFDGRKFDVTAVNATERSQDLAILKIDAADLPALPLGNSDELQEGQPVVAIGNPLGLERSVVSGVLSARREIEGRRMLQVALPIERGNSGGPLLDMQGRVHGLLTLKSLKTENLGFAIAVNSLKPLLEKPNPIPMSRWLTIGVMDPDEWTVLPGGRWRQRAGQIAADGRAGGFGGRSLCLAKEDPPEVPYEVAVQVKFAPGDGAAGLVVHADGGDRHYGFYPSNGNLRFSRFDGPDVYSWAVLRELRSQALRHEGWNSLRIRVEAERMICYLNGELVFEVNDVVFKTGKVGLCKFRQTEAEFKGFRMGTSLVDARPADGLLERVSKTIDSLTHDDASVAAAVEKLSIEDGAVLETLEQQAKSLEQRAGRLRRMAADVHAKQALSEFRKTTQAESIDLLRAALLIAKLDNPELDVNIYVHQVERHAKRVKAVLAEGASEDQRFAALNHYLFDEQGFHGSRTDYGHRSNSYVNEVLDDREGLPITLSVLYIEIAKHLGLNVVGVGMPSHFLARHEPKEGETQLIDVFDRGRKLSPLQARAIYEDLSGRSWQDAYLNAIAPQATLERMLRNLFSAATETADVERMLRYTEAVLIVNPSSARDHFRCGVLCYQTQRWSQARTEIEWLISHDADLNREEIDRQTVEELARAVARESQK